MADTYKTARRKKFSLEEKMITQWENESYCDVSIRVGEDIIKAHRCVLAASSQYFDILFTASFKEKDQDIVDLTGTFHLGEDLRTVFEYMYGKEIEITEENVEGLLQGGEVFDLPELTECCMKFLLHNLQLQNCLWCWSLAETYSLLELAEVCQNYAVCRFHDYLISMPESLRVPPSHLLKLMRAGLMKHCTAVEATRFVDKYINQDLANRRLYEKDLKAAAANRNVTVFDRSSTNSDIVTPDRMSCETGAGSTKPANCHIQDTLSKSEASPILASPEHGAKPKDLASSSASTGTQSSKAEDCLLLNLSDGNRWCLYRTTKNEWLTLPDTGGVIGKEWMVYQMGIGPNYEYATLQSLQHDHLKLLHMFTREITSVPRLPKLGPEKRALTLDRDTISMKNCDGEVHAFVYSVMRKKKKVPTATLR